MLKKLFGILSLILFFNGVLYAHSGKPKFHVIIDTDGALDDLRSISMFLSQNDTRVLAITCSQGTLLPEEIGQKVSTLLSDFHHEGIPVGIGSKVDKELPAWYPFSKNIKWGDSQTTENIEILPADELLEKVVKNYPSKITLVALGTLKTYADWFKENPQEIEKIDRIVWYNDPTIDNDFNYSVSPESYDYIKSLNIRLDIVGNNAAKFLIGSDYIEAIKNSHSIYAQQIAKVLTQPAIVEKIKQKHFILWDDIIPLYLTVPILFESEKENNIRKVVLNNQLPATFVYDAISKLLESGTTTNNRVFTSFPVDTSLYKVDYAKIVKPTLEKFGPIEWKAICMTNEIHGHTGIYSIVGAKMGVRAMEYFNVGVNNLNITTFAGHKPPLSCFNDGIQISSGATIGQGLITIADSIIKIPTVIVGFNNQKIEISVKPEIVAQMQKEIKYGVQTYGLESERYWTYIEKLAIKYWSEFERNEIFLIKRM